MFASNWFGGMQQEDDIHTVKEIYCTLSEITEEDNAKLAGYQVLNRDSNILSLLLFMIKKYESIYG